MWPVNIEKLTLHCKRVILLNMQERRVFIYLTFCSTQYPSTQTSYMKLYYALHLLNKIRVSIADAVEYGEVPCRHQNEYDHTRAPAVIAQAQTEKKTSYWWTAAQDSINDKRKPDG